MWNNLKSDLYRMLHIKSFYVMLVLCIIFYILIFTGTGFVSNSNFAQYNAGKDSFSDFLYFLPKSSVLQCIVLVYIGMFICDEYNSGFIKNTFPLITKKWKIIISRYVFFIIVEMIFFLTSILACALMQIWYQAAVGTINWLDYIIYLFTQIIFLATFASFMGLIQHLTKSRVLVILLGFVYSFMLLYTLIFGIGYLIAPQTHVTKYMLYEVSGLLPYTFSLEGYQTAFIVIIVFTLLYNGISYLLLRKKDII